MSLLPERENAHEILDVRGYVCGRDRQIALASISSLGLT